ncbi:E3 ubiquitin-protein ligase BRE1A [Hemiscyllium ocellatum]|uniref:E3 ubiquitin-protein ligase BRE1A n=1 Tax=Hemiscyllium ocellatum TaxID=170820 RepID=UPI002966B776|nr:E3 ubiquitin-protein ligase BRE1A [Hemiscyllium ocellatum]XP_060706308.1 E3 ubiquitin-protein ligase BRE1A [Hemiscyllium ocellatum]
MKERETPGAGSKRAAADPPPGPPEKSANLEESAGSSGAKVETIKLGSDSSTEELDIRTLQSKNRKLAEVIDQRQTIEDELREQIEKLVKRQATDDATLLILNRYWCQFDENVRIILQRWDLEQEQESRDVLSEKKMLVVSDPEPDSDSNQERDRREEREKACREGQSESALPFLAMLASSTSEEMELQLQDRVAYSRQAVSSTADVFEKLRLRIDQLAEWVTSNGSPLLEDALRELNSLLSKENQRLLELTDCLREKHHKMSQEFSELQGKLEEAESRLSDMQTTIEDLQWDTDKIRKREQRLNRHLAEVLERVKSKGYKVYGGSSNLYGGTVTINARKFEEMNCDLEENKELALNRLSELEKMRQDLQMVTVDNEKLRDQLKSLANEMVKDSPEFRCLQSQFSVLYNESLQLKAQMDDARSLLFTTRTTHQRQVEQMEGDEVGLQKKLRTEVMQLEDTLAQVRKEYEMLRIEFEQTLAANEQAGPINREMRHLISSLQNHNHQLKGDVQRYKRRLRDSHTELAKVRRKVWETHSELGLVRSRGSSGSQPQAGGTEQVKEEAPDIKQEPEDSSSKREKEEAEAAKQRRQQQQQEEEKEKEKEKEREREKREKERERAREKGREKDTEKDRDKDKADKERDRSKPEDTKKKEAEMVKQLRGELKRAQESQKEMKLLLDMYRSSPKEQRDKVQLMASEKRAKAELESLRQRLKELEEKERHEGKKMADVEALRRMKLVDEQMEHMLKKVAMAKQEEEALLSEMDVTGQAFEDMQEQNIRLMQQLREKDDANFKLMSERIKSNQIHKLLKEEKEELGDQLLTLKTQVDAQLQVVKKLEEKEQLLQTNLTAMEKELSLRTQTLDMHKRKAVEAAQLAEDLKLQLETDQKKLSEVQNDIIEGSVAREKETFNYKRAQEDISKLRRKLERQKKPEMFTNCDEILMEEIKDYKAKLTCPCCNMRKKDAVLTKCFHVFCFECVKTRYDTRQRKCPKCNAAFGANDFHRIYIG